MAKQMLTRKQLQFLRRGMQLRYWVEVSGTVECYFDRYNLFRVPNMLVSEILQVDDDEVRPLRDGFHYNRSVGENGEMFTKVIFGLTSDVVYHKVVSNIELGYAKFLSDYQPLTAASPCTIKQAIDIIDRSYRANNDDGFNELTPSWHRSLRSSLIRLKMAAHPNQTILEHIDRADYLMGDVVPLRLHML